MSEPILKSNKMANVLYDIRGPMLSEANRLENEGCTILKLNIGNTAPFGFDAPPAILDDIKRNLSEAQGYCDSKGLLLARNAIMQQYQRKHVSNVAIEDIYLGNGVSELIVMAMQGLLNDGDEMLVPSPDYPLWTAAVNLSGGTAVHYRCDEASDWIPDIDDIASKINAHTRGIVVINPNNPTGSVYPLEILEAIHKLAAERDLIVFSDEIYEKIVYDDYPYTSMPTICDDILCISFNGLSKTYRAPGFRTGWMVISGAKSHAQQYREGLDILSSMRLCSNVPPQFAIPTALADTQSIRQLINVGGRLREQRDAAHRALVGIPGVSCVKPRGSLYMFPSLDPRRFGIHNDMQFALDLLREKHILIVHGSGFNCIDYHHFRIVFLPDRTTLETAIQRIADFLVDYRQSS